MNNSLNLVLQQTARKLSVDPKLVESVYKSYWKFIRETISGNKLSDMSFEEFSSIDTNFNIPFIGKLYVEYDKIVKFRKKLNYYQNVKLKENQADRQSGTGD